MRSEELEPGALQELDLRGRPILVARLRSGEVVAAGGLCPHEQAPLAQGTRRGDAVDCPRHHYLFDLRTGRNLYPYPIYPIWKQKEVGELNLQLVSRREKDGWIRLEVSD